jgi:DNA-binding beta-propeller fold protein YncE
MISGILSLRSPLLCLAMAGLVAGCGSTPFPDPVTAKANITLPKDTVLPAIDLLTLDPRAGLLYVAHTSMAAMDVIDVHEGKVIGSAQGLIGIKAIAITHDPNIVYTSDADGNVAVVEVPTLTVKQKISVGGSPDAIEYDQLHDLVAVTLASDKAVAFIDVKTQKVGGKVPLPGDPGLMAVNQKDGSLYVAVHDKNEVVVIDPVALTITKTYKGCSINLPSGLAYDPDRGLLFVAGSAQLSIVDVVLDRCLGAVDIGHGTDQIAFNPHTHHVYTADGGSRYMSVIDAATLKPLGVIGTGRSAATIAVDPTTDLIYVAARPAGIIGVYHDP